MDGHRGRVHQVLDITFATDQALLHLVALERVSQFQAFTFSLQDVTNELPQNHLSFITGKATSRTRANLNRMGDMDVRRVIRVLESGDAVLVS
jgi:hypothetical protein